MSCRDTKIWEKGLSEAQEIMEKDDLIKEWALRNIYYDEHMTAIGYLSEDTAEIMDFTNWFKITVHITNQRKIKIIKAESL